MWKELLVLSDDKKQVIAKLPNDLTLPRDMDFSGLEEAMVPLNADAFFIYEEEVLRFLTLAKEGKSESFHGIVIAQKLDATVDLLVSEDDMLASMVVTGAYGGKPLSGPQVVQALASGSVTKGINKLALKKVLVVSRQLKPGKQYSQPVATGTKPVDGKDTQFVPLVKDVTKQVLAPVEDETGKVDMLNLGETVSVTKGQPLMRRVPPSLGKPGLTVQGKMIPAVDGKDLPLKEGKGSHISDSDPDLLVATVTGMPILQECSVDVDDVLVLDTIGVATGHVKFKGNLLVKGNVESDMKVRATGNITIGGFVESANIQAQGDVTIAKGIIGHNVSDNQKKSCIIKAGGSIKANYAQFAELQAGHDIELAIHCMNNEIRCGNNLFVTNKNGSQGTLSGGETKVGGKVVCVNLGVEGDTATYVHGFARYKMHKERQNKFREHYQLAQEATMDVVRKELEFKKRPKAERSEEEEAQIESSKVAASANLERIKTARDLHSEEFERLLVENTIQATKKVYTRVIVQFGDDKVTTKRVHGAATFSYNQYEIQCSSMMDEEMLEDDL
ncbi:polymerase [Vibrio panuliri]|uniref:Polymerase n=1 Tax=Vibrio panuliri TaxID=1381081 RepID=A0A1Q9HQG7_9VIBR|nr:FapA family protein [Vibrio panuliri]OLQ93111.1 polymerase [Vibrio panuliri]